MSPKARKVLPVAGVLAAVTAAVACAPDQSFRIMSASESLTTTHETTVSRNYEIPYNVTQEVSEDVVSKEATPVDILWMIDNSDSMRPEQELLAKGFESFGPKYLKPEYDVRMAVITTDTFLANPAYQDWINTWTYKQGKKTVSLKQVKPQWGLDYAKLLPGMHDGRPGNFTGTPILSTKPLAGSERALSTNTLVSKFKANSAVGIDGLYEEHGFESVLQMIHDNEAQGSPTPFFRKGSRRIIVFISDEDDQSLDLERTGYRPKKLMFHGSYYVGKDPKLAAQILPQHYSINCPSTELEGKTLAPMSNCVDKSLLISVDTVKDKLDAFFRGLDGSPDSSASPNYMVVAITGYKLETIEMLRSKEPHEITHEPGYRYMELADKVGNNSFKLDIGATDYTPVLDKIGLEIERHTTKTHTETKTLTRTEKRDEKKVEKISRFELQRVPTAKSDLKLTLVRADGQQVAIAPEQYSLEGSVVTITDAALLETFGPGDKLLANYQPATVR